MLITNLAFPVFAIGRTYLSGAIAFGTIAKGMRNTAFPLACSALNSISVAPITFGHAHSFYGIQQAMIPRLTRRLRMLSYRVTLDVPLRRRPGRWAAAMRGWQLPRR